MTVSPARVAIVSTYYPPVLGGAETASAQLAEFLVGRGHQVLVLTKRTRADVPVSEMRNGVHVVRVPPTGERAAEGKWLALPGLFAELVRRQADYDIVVCIDYRAVGLAALIARGVTTRPVIFQAATDGVISVARVHDAVVGRFQKWVASAAVWPFQRLYDGADAYPCISRAIEAETAAAGVPRDRIYYLPNPVDTRLFSAVTADQKAALRTRLGIPADARMAVIAGRLSREKGQLEAIMAWKHVTVAGALLVLVGPDMPGHPWDIGPAARALVANDGLGDRVRFVGGVSPTEVPDWFRVADVALQPSHFEAFGTAAIEAMAAGLPVIASDVGGLRDFVEPGLNGFRVAPQDPTALADAINRVLGDDVLRTRLAAGAVGTAPRFDTTVILGAFEQLIERVAATA